MPYNRLFIPLEFSADNKSKNNFELKIPSDRLINAASLKQLKIDKIDIATEKDKVITIKYCKSEKFEYLVSLLKTLCSKDILDINLESFETWKTNVKKRTRNFLYLIKATGISVMARATFIGSMVQNRVNKVCQILLIP